MCFQNKFRLMALLGLWTSPRFCLTALDVADYLSSEGYLVTLQNGVIEDRLVQLVLTKAVNLP